MKKIFLIGNCQARPLTWFLNYLVEDAEFFPVMIHSLAPSKAKNHINQAIERIRAEGDFVLSFVLSDKFYGLHHDVIRETFEGIPLLTISNLYFAGYHPDVTTIGIPHQRVDGPLSQYRSRLAVFGFMKGWSIADTKKLFNGETYQRLSYFDDWKTSAQRLLKSDERIDIKFAPALTRLLKSRLCMHVFNHPTTSTFLAWSKAVAKDLEERGVLRVRDWTPDEQIVPSPFAESETYPIYPEIAEAHGLRFPGSYVFKGPGFTRGSFMNLEEYIAAEFAALENSTADAIRQSPQWHAVERRCEPLLG